MFFKAISNALSQGNLSPELEEKLVNMQKQQDQQNANSLDNWESANDDVLTTSRRNILSRQQNIDNVEWKIRTPLRRPNAMTTCSQFNRVLKKNRRANEDSEELEEEKQSKLERHKELLKKSILRKRSLLERNLQNEIREEVQNKVQRHGRPISIASPEEQSENERSYSDRRRESDIDFKRFVILYNFYFAQY